MGKKSGSGSGSAVSAAAPTAATGLKAATTLPSSTDSNSTSEKNEVELSPVKLDSSKNVADSSSSPSPSPSPVSSTSSTRSSTAISRWLLPYALDLRALAFFRISVAIVMLFDLTERVGQFDFFYSDTGVWPLENHMRELSGEMFFSLFFISPNDYWQMLVFLFCYVVAILFLVGWRTHIVKFLVWMCLISCQNRILIGASGGDDLLISCVFWSLWMPLSERWSIDAMMKKPTDQEPILPRSQRNSHWSIASSAFNLQPLMMYAFSYFLKIGREWYPDCTALYYALSGADYVRPFGVWLRENAPYDVLKALTAATLVLELFGNLLVISPWYHVQMKIIGVLAFLSFHFGILITLALGNFQYICGLVLITLFPRQVWDAIENKLLAIRGAFGRLAPAMTVNSAKATTTTEKTSPSTPQTIRIVLVRPVASSSTPLTTAADQAHFDEQCDFFRKTLRMLKYLAMMEEDEGEVEVQDGQQVGQMIGNSNGHANGNGHVNGNGKNGATNGHSSFASSSSSWRVIDSEGHPHYGRSAFLAIAARTFPFRFLRQRLGLSLNKGSILSMLLLPLTTFLTMILQSPYLLSWYHFIFSWSSTPSAITLKSRWPYRDNFCRNLVCGILLTYVLLQNMSSVPWMKRNFPVITRISQDPFHHPAMLLKLDQRWAMFAPSPYTQVTWTVLRGRLAPSTPSPYERPRYVDVETWDLNSNVSFVLPEYYSYKYPNVFMFDFIDDMEGQEEHYWPWVAWHCRKWNRIYKDEPKNKLVEIEMFMLSVNTTLPGEPESPIVEDLVWTQDCGDYYVNIQK